MTIVIIIEKENIKENKIDHLNDLYKKCKFKKADDFNEIKVWNFNKKIIKLFGKTSGKKTSKNLYNFPDINTSIYGSCALVCYENNELVDIKISFWEDFKNQKDKILNNLDNKNTNIFNQINIENKLYKEEIESDDDKDYKDEKDKDYKDDKEKECDKDKEDDIEDYDEIDDNELSGEEEADYKENSDIEIDDDIEKECDKDNIEEEKYFSGSELTEDVYVYSSDED